MRRNRPLPVKPYLHMRTFHDTKSEVPWKPARSKDLHRFDNDDWFFDELIRAYIPANLQAK